MSAEGMPPPLLELFTARVPSEFIKPAPKKPTLQMSGIAAYLANADPDPPPPVKVFETPKQRQARLKAERAVTHQKRLRALVNDYTPARDDNATSDPFATLFVGRISYETTEKKLKREFEVYGPTRRVRMVTDQSGKPRGYAFIEFESERDMKEAYKHSDGKKIDGRRVLVDVERGRTVNGWLPRRLGGGRGAPRFVEARAVRRRTAPVPAPLAGAPSGAPPGGYRGGAFSGGGPPAQWRGPHDSFNGQRPANPAAHQSFQSRNFGGPQPRGRGEQRRDSYNSYSSRDQHHQQHRRSSRSRSRSRGRRDSSLGGHSRRQSSRM